MTLPIKIIIALSLSLFLFSCSESSKFEKDAKEQSEQTLKETIKNSSTLTIGEVETLYCDDSLCFLRFNCTYQNRLGRDTKRKYEYIYLSSNGKKYELYNDLDDSELVFVSPEEYESSKHNFIYQKLDYADGIRYIAVVHLNENGNEVGRSKKEKINIPIPCGLGDWKLKFYKDEFGEEGAAKYIEIKCNGFFSNSATTDAETFAYFCLDSNSNFFFQLYEYKDLPVKMARVYDFKIKDSQGVIHEFALMNNHETGRLTSSSPKIKETINTVLSKGGIVNVAVKEREYCITPTIFRFTIDLTGLEKAKEFILKM